MLNSLESADRPCVVVLTAAGRGAIAVVRVTGPGSAALMDDCFVSASGKPLSSAVVGAIRFGAWRDSGEEVVACRRGPEEIEIHCHGGAAAVRAIVRSLVQRGAKDVVTEASSPRDSTFAELAWRELSHAPTQRTAGILLDQTTGVLDRAVEEIFKAPELLRWAEVGLHLTQPWRVVLAGPPNAGKSSLANALLGFGRSIVFDEPGTTREVVTTVTAIDGWPVAISDTAGLRATRDPLEAAGVEQTVSQIAQADLVIDVIPSDVVDFSHPGNANHLRVLSKADLGAPANLPTDVLPTSVRTGQGVSELLAAIGKRLVPEAPPAGAAVPLTIELVEELRRRQAASGSS